jgi:hypothetical protein
LQPQSRVLLGRKSKHEVRREALAIAFDLLIQTLYRNAVKFGQISVQDDLAVPQNRNAGFNGFLPMVILNDSLHLVCRFEIAICDLKHHARKHEGRGRRARATPPGQVMLTSV